MGKKSKWFDISDSCFMLGSTNTQYFDEIVVTLKDIFMFHNNHFMLDIFYTVIPHFCLKKKKKKGKKHFENI